MGAWGTGLYANDTASDIKFEYVDMLRRGVRNEEIVAAMIRDQGECIDDPEDAPLFWFALADMQWNYGRLMPEVKEKALYYLTQDGDLEVWREAGIKKLNAWLETRKQLEEKLHTPQPPVKKVMPYRVYKCEWKLGDVFAYQFQGEISKAYGCFGKYIVFRKIDEGSEWPGNIVPIIEISNWIGDHVPSLEEVRQMELLPIGNHPLSFARNPNLQLKYRIRLLSTSRKVIPKERLTFIGNLPAEVKAMSPWVSYMDDQDYLGWEGTKINRRIEKEVIECFFAWKKFRETGEV